MLERLTAALADRYVIARELGAGGMARVYLARDLKHDRQVAIKVLRPQLAASVGAERFLREIGTMGALRHPHILPMYESGEADSFLYYVMPVIEGESLADRLQREGQLPIDEAVQIAREVAGALGYAHAQGIVHRDVKPANILLDQGHAVLADFGIARAVGSSGGEKLTASGLSIGTPTYMSPEQSFAEDSVDSRTDLYALGCVLYEMLGGEPPHTGSTPHAIIAKRMSEPVPKIRTLRETVPPHIEAAIMRMLAKSAVDRFPTAEAFLQALSNGAPVTAPRAVSDAPSKRSWRLGRFIAVGLLLLALGLAARCVSSRGDRLSDSDRLISALVVRDLASGHAERGTVSQWPCKTFGKEAG